MNHYQQSLAIAATPPVVVATLPTTDDLCTASNASIDRSQPA